MSTLQKVCMMGEKIQYLNPPEVIINKFSKDKDDKRVFDLIRPWDFESSIVAGIIGVPFDSAIAGRAGAREAPKTVRLAFRYNSTYNFDFNVDIQSMKVADMGDVATVHTSVVETHERIEGVLSEIYERGIIPIIIGGDHSITFPAVKALCNNTTGNVGVIGFDSHLDLRTYHGIHISSGTPFRRILDIKGKPVSGKNLVEIGLHGFVNSFEYKNYAVEKNITMFSALQVRKLGIEDIMENALKKAGDGTDAIYVSIDIDCLDQSFAPGVSAPSPAGLTSWDVLNAAFMAGKHHLVKGIDIVEISPPLDVKNLTSNVGATIILSFLGGLSKRNQD